MATNKEYQALIDALSGECERLHKENNELKTQINDVLDKIRDEIASLPTNNISRRYAFEAIDQYRIIEIIDRHKK